jgi:hypothetical protein
VNGLELRWRAFGILDPNVADHDGDGLSTYEEVMTYGTGPSMPDTPTSTAWGTSPKSCRWRTRGCATRTATACRTVRTRTPPRGTPRRRGRRRTARRLGDVLVRRHECHRKRGRGRQRRRFQRPGQPAHRREPGLRRVRRDGLARRAHLHVDGAAGRDQLCGLRHLRRRGGLCRA